MREPQTSRRTYHRPAYAVQSKVGASPLQSVAGTEPSGRQTVELVAAWTETETDENALATYSLTPASTVDTSASDRHDDQADGDDEQGNSDRGRAAAADGTAKQETPPETLPSPASSIRVDELSLEDVLVSVARSYPPLAVAIGELAAADGKALSTWGSFDTILEGRSISAPLGFYQNYRNGANVRQPLWKGGEVYGGYRIGDGDFQPWFGERETNEGGEFKTGFKQPLLKNFAIDSRRADLEIAQLERIRLEPNIQTRILEIERAAAQLYWQWVAAGQVVQTREELLRIAEERARNLVARVEAGDLPEITVIDNGRFIAKRQTTLIKARRKLQASAIKLSLFYRDEVGKPIVVDPDRLPSKFPRARKIDPQAVEADIAQSLTARPELRDLEFQRQQLDVELRYAENQTLPKVDAFAIAGQDVGGAASPKRDKSPFELELGVRAEVPIQRREAVGKIRAVEAKLGQLVAKRQFVEDKIRSQVQDAVSALNLAYQAIERSQENLRLNRQSLRLGRQRFDEGDIDIIELNIYETSLAEAELLLTAAEFEYFAAWADYRAALGVVDLP